MQESTEAITLKHRVEPSLRTIYVEGPTDQTFYQQCLTKLNILGVHVFDISMADLTSFPFHNYGLDPRENRDKVIALSLLSHQNGLANLNGIIDADFDHIQYNILRFPNIFRTDGSCAEAYFWDTDGFNRFLSTTTKKKLSGKIGILADALNAMFSIRLVNRKYMIPHIDWIKYFDITTGFNHSEYIKNFIIRARKSKEIDYREYTQCVNYLISQIHAKHVAINGHDLIDLVIHVINDCNNRKCICDSDVLQSMLYSLDCYDEIVQCEMFKRLQYFAEH